LTTATSPFSLKRKAFALFGSAVLVALLAACGGGGDDEDTDTSTTTTTTSAAGSSTAASSGGTTSSSGGTTSSSGSSSAPSTANFSNLNSYKYTMKMSGKGGALTDITGGLGGSGDLSIEISGAYIKPDKAQTSLKLAGFQTSMTIIGNQQWTTFAGQTQGPTPATQSDVDDANILASFWDSVSPNVKDFKCSGKENVNGVSAQKCTADKAVLDKLAKEQPDFLEGINATSLSNSSKIDMWVADAGYPVRVRMDVSGKDTSNADFSYKVDMDVTDINGNFQITAPKS
jgi:hypothetical protein